MITFQRLGPLGAGRGLRSSVAGIILPLVGWAQCREKGNAFILATATVRHSSARILEKLGGFGLQLDGKDLPAFHDSYHQCELKILGFDSRVANPKYEPLIEELGAKLYRNVAPKELPTSMATIEL